MSKRAFAALISLWIALGLGASGYAASLTTQSHPGLLVYLLVGLAIPTVGICLNVISSNPVVSLLGYMLVVVPLGLVAGPAVALYTAASVARVLTLTTGMVVALGVIGAAYPKSLESRGIWLLGGLVVLVEGMLVLEMASRFGVDVGAAWTVWDWVGVVLFSGYVIYDMNRAMHIDRTVDNSIDCACALYLDFVNIFVRVLKATGERKGNG